LHSFYQPFITQAMSRAMTVRRTRWWLGYGQWWYAEAEDWTPDFWEETWIPLGEGKGNAAEGKGKASWGKGRPAAEGKGIAPGSASAVAGGKGNASWGQGLASWGKGKGKAAKGKGKASCGNGKAAAEGKGNAPGSASAVAGGKGNAAEGKGNAPGSASAVAGGKGKAAAEGKGNAAEGKGNAAEGNSNRQNQQWAQWKSTAQWAQLVQAEAPRLRWAGAVTADWVPTKRQRTSSQPSSSAEWLRPQNQPAWTDEAELRTELTQAELDRFDETWEFRRRMRARGLAALMYSWRRLPEMPLEEYEQRILDYTNLPDGSSSSSSWVDSDQAFWCEASEPDDEPAP
jgi:hypothetical protein